MSYSCHVYADLMRPTCLELALDVSKIFKPLKDFKLGNGGLTVGDYRHFLAVNFIASDSPRDNSRVVSQDAIHYRPISPRRDFIFNLRVLYSGNRIQQPAHLRDLCGYADIYTFGVGR